MAANMALIAHSFGCNMIGIRWGYEHGSCSKQFHIIADVMVQIPLPVTIMLDFKMVAEMAITESFFGQHEKCIGCIHEHGSHT